MWLFAAISKTDPLYSSICRYDRNFIRVLLELFEVLAADIRDGIAKMINMADFSLNFRG